MLVVVAFSGARWVAMGFNRIADREFDARNPRTLNRELPRGALTAGAGMGLGGGRGLALRAAAAGMLNRSACT